MSDWSSDVCSSDLRCRPTGCFRRPRSQRSPPGWGGCNDGGAGEPGTRPARRRGDPARPGATASRRVVDAEELPLLVGGEQFRGRHLVHRRSEEHTSELQSLMRISYAVFCLKKKNNRIAKLILIPIN